MKNIVTALLVLCCSAAVFADEANVVGKWESAKNKTTIIYDFGNDGKFKITMSRNGDTSKWTGTYKVSDGVLKMINDDDYSHEDYKIKSHTDKEMVLEVLDGEVKLERSK